MDDVLEFLSSNKDAFIAAGVIIGAITAMITSWWASRATHRSMVAQMRERWIESLRTEIAEIKSMSLILQRRRFDEGFNAYDHLHKIQVLGHKMLLRLNTENPSHKKLEDAFYNYVGAFNDPNNIKSGDTEGDEFVKAARSVIRQTWKKAEKGKL